MEMFVLDFMNVIEVFEDFVIYIYEGVKKRENEKKLRMMLFFLVDYLVYV